MLWKLGLLRSAVDAGVPVRPELDGEFDRWLWLAGRGPGLFRGEGQGRLLRPFGSAQGQRRRLGMNGLRHSRVVNAGDLNLGQATYPGRIVKGAVEVPIPEVASGQERERGHRNRRGDEAAPAGGVGVAGRGDLGPKLA